MCNIIREITFEANIMFTRQLLILVALYSYSNLAQAVEIFECRDESGTITFQDRCPPGSTPVNERNYRTDLPSGAENAQLEPIRLYMIPDCDTCSQVKEFLEIRNLQFSEVDVSEDIELQEELTEVAGELKVPVLLVGDRVLNGYNRTVFIQALTESGHLGGE
jgi:glutaredoxin